MLKVEPRWKRRPCGLQRGRGQRYVRADNANKRSAVLNPADAADRDRLIDLAAAADIVVDSGNPGRTAAFGTSCAELSRRFAHLVAMSVTDFGADGPRASWRATDPVFYAMSTALSRSGPTAGRPVLPPNGIASATAAVQAAWAALVAYYNRLRYVTGDYIDFSRFEAVVQSLDPPFGSEGQAAVGQKRSNELWRGRPRNQQIYPTFECRDGYVRICLLSARQWRGMRAWLGEPEQFQDPKFDTIAARYGASREINALIAELFGGQTMDEVVTAGQARGVPIAAVLSPAETLSSEHFRSVDALTDATIAPGVDVTVPVGPFVIDGGHAGFVRPAPTVGGDEPAWSTPRSEPAARPDTAATNRPLEGLRILDLGVIVAGGELGRLFADLGAEVIKIESATFPDGLRQTPPGMMMSRSWALTHRNEYALGLDLRRPEGADIFSRLVEGADAVFANFKPGTLASLGFSYQKLHELNPRIVLAESSAFGATGPWSARMGYGPLVRATTGVTRLWTSVDDPGFYDATTIFPDHVVARSRDRRAGVAGRPRPHRDRCACASPRRKPRSASFAASRDRRRQDREVACHRRSRRARRLCVRWGGRVVCDLAAVQCRSRGVGDGDGSLRPARRPCRSPRRGVGVDVANGQGRRRRVASAGGCTRRPDEPGGRCACRSCAAVPEVVHRHGASTVRPPDAHRDESRTVRASGRLRPARCRRHTREICQKLLALTPRRSNA